MARRLARGRAILQQRLFRRGFVVAGVVALLAGLLLTLGVSRTTERDQVKQMMALFKASADRPDFETVLVGLAEGRQPMDEQLQALAAQTAELADTLAARRVEGWQGVTRQMKDSARELSAAIEKRDQAGAAQAALRLRASCVQCHQAVEQERKTSSSIAPPALDTPVAHAPGLPDAPGLPPTAVNDVVMRSRESNADAPGSPETLTAASRFPVAAAELVRETGVRGTLEPAGRSHLRELGSRPPGSATSIMT
jgi:hypothetical protein